MGERGMLTGQRRNATARTHAVSVVLDVPDQVMQRLMEIVPSVRSFFEQLNNVRSIESVMKRMALFQGISDPDIHWMANKIQFKYYDRDALLFTESEQGQPPREFLHIILEGFVKVARRTTTSPDQTKRMSELLPIARVETTS